MTNVFQDAATWLAERIQAAAGRSVTFTRGVMVSDAVTGCVSMHEYEVLDNEGFPTSVQAWEWTFKTSDLPYTPRAGDRLTETLSGASVAYECLPVAGKPATEWLDTSGVLTVVRTKKVS